MDAHATQPRRLLLRQALLRLEEAPALIVHQAELAAQRRQAQVGVVLAQQQAILGAAGEHPVRLPGPSGHQVIDEHAEIRLAALRHPGLALAASQRRIDAGDNALRRGLLVPGRAVDLAGEEETLKRSSLERGAQIPRVEVVVLDRVARPGQVCTLESSDAAHELVLHVERQAGGDAVGIDLVRVEALGLDEDLMRGLAGEAEDLVLDRGTVPRTHPFDDAR